MTSASSPRRGLAPLCLALVIVGDVAAAPPPAPARSTDVGAQAKTIHVSWDVLSKMKQSLARHPGDLDEHQRMLLSFLKDNVKDSAVDSVLFLVFDTELMTVSYLSMRTDTPVVIWMWNRSDVQAILELCQDYVRGFRQLRRNREVLTDPSQGIEARARALDSVVRDSRIPISTKVELVEYFKANASSDLAELHARDAALEHRVRDALAHYDGPSPPEAPAAAPHRAAAPAGRWTVPPEPQIPAAAPPLPPPDISMPASPPRPSGPSIPRPPDLRRRSR